MSAKLNEISGKLKRKNKWNHEVMWDFGDSRVRSWGNREKLEWESEKSVKT